MPSGSARANIVREIIAIVRQVANGLPPGPPSRSSAGLSARIAAAVVSLNGHKRIRRQPDFLDRNFLGFSNSGKE
jgi:hypothetical protein